MRRGSPSGGLSAMPLLLCLGLITACEGPGDSEISSNRRTIALSESPIVTIGGIDDRPDYLVHQLVDALRLSDGRIVIAQRSTSDVRYYSSSGEHLRTSGQEGDGPGEFRRILAMIRAPGDTIVVLSASPGITWLSPTGDYVRSSRVVPWGRDRHPCRIAGSDWLGFEDASWVTVFDDNLGIGGCPPLESGVRRVSGLVERMDLGAEVFDTLGVFPSTERNGASFRVFGRNLVVAAGPTALLAADSGGDSIVVVDMGGAVVRAMPIPFAARPVPESAKGVKERPPVNVPPGVPKPPGIDAPYEYPESYPRLARLLWDRSGYVWVMKYPELAEPLASYRLSLVHAFLVPEGGAEWAVLDEHGSVVAQVTTPRGFFPLEVGESYVLGVSMDDYDVQAVQVYELRR